MSTEHPAPTLQEAPRRRASTTRLVRSGAAGLVGALALTGCSLTSLTSMSPDLPRRPEPAVSTAPVRPVAATAPVVVSPPRPTAPRGDLAAGSLTRRLDAGKRTLVATYWTEQDPSTWTAERPTVVRLSAHLEDAGTRHRVRVTRFLVTLDDGTVISTVADDRGEFVLTPPYSYDSALNVQTSDPSATTARLSLQWDLLVETAPRSGAFFRQTVLDTVDLAFAASSAPAASNQESDHR